MRSLHAGVRRFWAACVALPLVAAAADALPFQHKVEVYRNKEGDVSVFTVRSNSRSWPRSSRRATTSGCNRPTSRRT